MDVAVVLLRLVAGLTLAAHGSQKLFGAFGGGGIAGTRTFFTGLGFRRPHLMALAAGTGELAQLFQVARPRLGDPIWAVHARALRADERTFQVQAKDAVAPGHGTCGRNGATHLFARVSDQSRQAGRGAVATMRARNRTHAIGGRLIIEQNAAAPVHLQIYEPGRHENACGNTRLQPTERNLARRNEAGDAAVLDHYGGVVMPGATVKNTVCGPRTR